MSEAEPAEIQIPSHSGTLGLRHAALAVRDLELSRRFYQELLGFSDYHVSDQDWAMVSRSGTTLSFVRVASEASGGGPPLLRPGSPGVHPEHLGFTFASPDAVDRVFEKARVLASRSSAPSWHRDGSYGFYCSDPDGNSLECIFIPHAPMSLRPGPRGPEIALVLLAHGSADPAWRAPFERLLQRVRLNAPGLPCALAYLEFARPTLGDAIRALAQPSEIPPPPLGRPLGRLEEKPAPRGLPRTVVVQPLLLASGGHMARDVPELLRLARESHPEIEFVCAPPVGEDEGVQDALIVAALANAGAQLGRVLGARFGQDEPSKNA